jgi:threonyl-tRNA synthetase
LQAKIRDAEVEKVPVIMIIGDNEVEEQKMTLRTRGKAKDLIKEKEVALKDLEKWGRVFER